MAYLRHQPCVVGVVRGFAACVGRSQACHLLHDGWTGTKPIFGNTFPACAAHHTGMGGSFHTMGVASFQKDYGIDLEAVCRWYAESWDRPFGETQDPPRGAA